MNQAPLVARRLFLLGFLTLFLELLLIRFLAGNIWNLGFFPNLVLLGVFVGMGTGFVFHHRLTDRQSTIVYALVPPALLLFVVLIYTLKPAVPGFQSWSAEIGGELYFTDAERKGATAGYGLFLGWFGSVALMFAMISQYTAKAFAQLEPLWAYTCDIAGSCCGILAFMLISWLHIPAAVWFLALAPLFYFTLEGWRGASSFALAASFVVAALIVAEADWGLFLAGPNATPKVAIWSPYQKVELKRDADPYGVLYVNGIGHQKMFHPQQLPGSYYQSVYDHRKQKTLKPLYKSVLIIGAGSGNDVMTALLNGAERVDAVEIDPILAQIGRQYHPARPYDDPRVSLHIDDGRSFMVKTRHTYDLIIFALTDSLVKVSPMAQLRLENYLFTTESVRRAFGLLNEGGSLVFYNHYRKPWLREKVEGLIVAGTGLSPQLIFQQADMSVLMADRGPAVVPTAAGENAALAATSVAESTVEIPTDDWPFLYLQERHLPPVYMLAMLILTGFVALMLFALELTGRRRGDGASRAGSIRLKLAFVLMGIAFLLLETKSIIQFSLLFGTTWLTNSLVFLAVLLSVLAANWVAWLLPSRKLLWLAFALLIVSCGAAFVYPLGNLLHVEDRVQRFVLASLLTFSPIAFANLIFSLIFRGRTDAEHYFGWNLIGATLGGVLEYTSMTLGYNWLAVLVALCYALVFALVYVELRAARDDLTQAAPASLPAGEVVV